MIDFTLGAWASTRDSARRERRFVHEADLGNDTPAGLTVVSALADPGRIDALLASGADQVLLGECALHDATLVAEAVARHGGERIGVWLPVRRGDSSWRFDTASNADFRVVSVTDPVPRWMVLRADHTLTEVDARWWAGEMLAAGCTTVLVSVDAPTDDDLLACADMAEQAGERFWLDTGSDDVEELRFWLRYGQARRLVLPAGCRSTTARTDLERRLAHDDSTTAGTCVPSATDQTETLLPLSHPEER